MRRKTKSIFLSLLFLLFSSTEISIAHAETGSLEKAVKKLIGDTKPSLTILYPKGSLPNIQLVANSFNKQTGVDIKLSETSVDDINTRMLLGAVSQSNQFDIALPATFGIPDLVEAGALADLSQYAAKYEPQVDYQASLYDLGDRYKGKFYGYQTDGDTYLMFYNQPMLDNPNNKTAFKSQYGYSLGIPQTWKELST